MKGRSKSFFGTVMASFFTTTSSPAKSKQNDVSAKLPTIQSIPHASASKSKSNEPVMSTDVQFAKEPENNPVVDTVGDEVLVNSVENIANELHEVDPPVMIFIEEQFTHEFRDETDDNLNLSPYVSDEDCERSGTKSSGKTTYDIEKIAAGWESEKDALDVEMTFTCRICGKCCHTKNILERHSQEHDVDQFIKHIDVSKNFVPKATSTVERPNTGVEDIRLACQYCDESFVDQFLFINHCRTHMVGKNYICTICGVLFEEKDALVYHRTAHLGRRRKVRRRIAGNSRRVCFVKVFKCKDCIKSCRSLDEFKQHKVQVHGKPEIWK